MDTVEPPEFRDWAAAARPRLRRTAYLLSGDWHLAEDLAQETLLRMYAVWGRVTRIGAPDAYARRTLINLYRSTLRRPSRREYLTDVMPELAAELEGDVADAYRAAHEQYIADREGIEVVPELAGISAGGMPVRVKCLHALAGHALAAGPGVNPIGDRALELATWSPEVCECVDYSSAL